MRLVEEWRSAPPPPPRGGTDDHVSLHSPGSLSSQKSPLRVHERGNPHQIVVTGGNCPSVSGGVEERSSTPPLVA